jgi:hypothetical protein
MPRGRALVVAGVAGVLFAGLIFALATNLLRSASEGSVAAPTEFDVGPAEQRRAVVERDGPLLFQDPLGRGRDIYVQYVGPEGWKAFEARAPGAPRRCVLEWQPADRRFRDPCTGATYPADGTGLVSYPTRVDDDGRLRVDLRTPIPPAGG